MGYWLEDSEDTYLGDLASNMGMKELREAGVESLTMFLEAGEADGDLVDKVMEETEDRPELSYIAGMLEKAVPPVYVTDGCGEAGEPNE